MVLFRPVGNHLILDHRTEGSLPHCHRYAPSFFRCPSALCTDAPEEHVDQEGIDNAQQMQVYN
jgi:hypothetical protein